MDVAGTSALVTGGASGLGLATVRKLREKGASVAILDLPSSQGDAIAKELGDQVVFSPGDVTSPDDVAAAVEAASALGPPRNRLPT
jgi:NAD(P)-dependent dehydrogenase (short-subunit alcohol dehydrogenase family)